MRWITGILAVGLLCVVGHALAQEKEPEKKTLADELAALRKEVQSASAELSKKFQAAETDAEKDAIRDQFGKVRAEAAKKALQLAKNTAKDEGVVDAAIYAVQNGEDDVAGEAAAMLVEKFADSPKFTAAIPAMMQSAGGRAALAKMAEKTDDREKKATLLINLAAMEVENTDYPRTGKPLPPAEAAKVYAAAKVKLEALARDYADVEIPGRTPAAPKTKVGDKAKSLLAFIDTLTVGKVAPDVECETLDGKKQKLSDYRGKVVVVDIWATWCGPCVAMIPHETELVQKLKDKPFALLSVSADAKKETLEKFLETKKMPWHHWWNGQRGGVVETFQVRFFPTVYVLDAKGVIRYKHVRGKAMDDAVETLLKEMEKESK